MQAQPVHVSEISGPGAFAFLQGRALPCGAEARIAKESGVVRPALASGSRAEAAVGLVRKQPCEGADSHSHLHRDRSLLPRRSRGLVGREQMSSSLAHSHEVVLGRSGQVLTAPGVGFDDFDPIKMPPVLVFDQDGQRPDAFALVRLRGRRLKAVGLMPAIGADVAAAGKDAVHLRPLPRSDGD